MVHSGLTRMLYLSPQHIDGSMDGCSQGHVNKSKLRLSSAFKVSLRSAERETNDAVDGRALLNEYVNTTRLDVQQMTSRPR